MLNTQLKIKTQTVEYINIYGIVINYLIIRKRYSIFDLPVRQMPARLQTHSTPTRLAECVPLKHDEAVCVGHQQVKAKVESCPTPTVLK